MWFCVGCIILSIGIMAFENIRLLASVIIFCVITMSIYYLLKKDYCQQDN